MCTIFLGVALGALLVVQTHRLALLRADNLKFSLPRPLLVSKSDTAVAPGNVYVLHTM